MRKFKADNNVEKMFASEIRDKKRIGSNIFSRVSTRKGGSQQALRTPYLFMKNKERKQLNGKVVRFNMNELMTYQELMNLDRDMQKQIVEKWREQYGTKEIIDSLKISKKEFYQLINDLGVKKLRDAPQIKKPVSIEKLEDMKRNLVSFKEFMDLPTDQRAEVFHSYLKEYSTKELSELWELKGNRIHTLKFQLSKKMDEMQKGGEQKSSFMEDLNGVDEAKEVIEKKDKTSDDALKEEFFFTINQKGESESIVKKLELLINLLEDGGDYNISLTVKRG